MVVDFVNTIAKTTTPDQWISHRRIESQNIFLPTAAASYNSFPVRYLALFGPKICVSKTQISFCPPLKEPHPDAAPCSLDTSQALCASPDGTLVLPADTTFQLPPQKHLAPSETHAVCVDTLAGSFWTESFPNKDFFALVIAIMITFIGRMMFSPWDNFDYAGIIAASIGAVVIFVMSAQHSHIILSVASLAYIIATFTIMITTPSTARLAKKRAQVHSRGIILISTAMFGISVSSGFAFAIATIFSFRSWKHIPRTFKIARNPPQNQLFASMIMDITMLVMWGVSTVPPTLTSIEPVTAVILWISTTALAASTVRTNRTSAT